MAALAIIFEDVVSDQEPLAEHEADRSLAHAAASGDRSAAEALTRRLLPLVRRVARALLADQADVDDAVQLALLEVLRACGSYRATGSLEAWARRIVSRCIIRHAKRTRRARSETMPHDESIDPRRALLRTDVVDALPRDLRDYLDELPEVQRLALVLRHALGHTVPEIAELTDAPIPTVKSRLKKAHLELRRLIRRDVNIGVHAEASSS